MAVALLACMCCTTVLFGWVGEILHAGEICFQPDWGIRSHLVRKKCPPNGKEPLALQRGMLLGSHVGLRHTLLTLVFVLLVF